MSRKIQSSFRKKGTDILKPDTGINNIKDFLEDKDNGQNQKTGPTPTSAGRRHPSFAQTHIATTVSNVELDKDLHTKSEKIKHDENLVRIHAHIRKDIADRLLEETYKRKRKRPLDRKDATQRAIIEQALIFYFDNSN